MKLATVPSVRHLIVFEDIKDVNDAIESALEEATAFLEGELRTSFALETGQVDTFYIDRSPKFTGSFRTRLLLDKGFLTDTVVTYNQYGSYGAIIDGATPEDVTKFATLKAEYGTVTFNGVEFIDKFIQITYDHGFGVDSGDAGLYKQSEVPDWLKAVARLQAVVVLDTTAPTMRHDKAEPRLAEEMRARVGQITSTHKRYFPAYQPTLS